MKKYSQFKTRLLKDKDVQKAYKALEPEFVLAYTVIEKRIEKGLTQSQLAHMIGTKQSAISRLESGNYNPSVVFLRKIARALKLNLQISFT